MVATLITYLSVVLTILSTVLPSASVVFWTSVLVSMNSTDMGLPTFLLVTRCMLRAPVESSSTFTWGVPLCWSKPICALVT